MELNKQKIEEIKKYHKISEPLRLEIANADFSKSSADFSKIFFALSVLSAQQWATRIQKTLTQKLNMEHVPSSYGRGDCVDNKNYFYYEIKCSVITKTNDTLNMVQIREWEDLKGYFICGIDLRNE